MKQIYRVSRSIELEELGCYRAVLGLWRSKKASLGHQGWHIFLKSELLSTIGQSMAAPFLIELEHELCNLIG